MATSAFVHEALLVDVAEDDVGAPGAAITVELCGHWQHAGPCRWPHYTSTAATAQGLTVRTLFVCAPAEETMVRSRIDAVLAAGVSPLGEPGRAWRLAASAPADLLPHERDQADRLAGRD